MQEINEMEKIIKLAYIRIGVKCDLVGYSYLCKATELVIADSEKLYDMKALYKDIAQIYGVDNPIRVESNIQNAINLTYKSRGFSALNEIYKMPVVEEGYKPSAAELVKLVAEFYRLGIYNSAN